MYTEQDLKKLGADYKKVKAPEELLATSKEILGKPQKQQKNRSFLKPLTAAACILLCFAAGLNISPVFAAAMEEIPLLAPAVRLLTFREYEQTGENYEVKIGGGEISGLPDEEISKNLNAKYSAQAKELYQNFMEKLDGNIENITLYTEYSIKADNGTTLSIQHSIYESAASGYERYEYDTVDIHNGVYITLPSLFTDDTYIDIITSEIISQMDEQMAGDDSKIYFTGNDGLTQIQAHQQFYINNSHQLVITFDEYEAAPGYMGPLEFIIPTSTIQDILVGNTYIQ